MTAVNLAGRRAWRLVCPLMVNEQKIAELLSYAEIFASLTEEQRLAVANVTRLVEYKKGERIVTQGEPGRELFILISGKVTVLVEDLGLGVEHPVLTLGPRQSFGEMSLLTEAPRSATVRADENTWCICLARPSFDSLLEKLPRVAVALSRYLAKRLHRQCQLTGFQFVNLSQLVYDPEVYQILPHPLLRRFKAVPLKLENGTLTVALTRPNDAAVLDALRQNLPGLGLDPVACSSDDYETFLSAVLEPALAACCQQQKEQSLALGALALPPGKTMPEALESLLLELLSRGGEQFFLEPWPEGPRVKLRCLGELVDWSQPLTQPLYEKLFVALMGLTEQASRSLTLSLNEQPYELRVHSLPTRHGPRLAVSVIDFSRLVLPLPHLLTAEALQEWVRSSLLKSGKTLVVAGPARSGRSTTLYSLMHSLVTEAGRKSLLAVEDRPLASLPGLVQVAAGEQAEMEQRLQEALRHRPDYLMVDEVKNPEGLEAALDASLDGITVLLSRRAGDAVSAVTGLHQLGLAPELYSAAIDLVISQQLLRRICPHCRQPVEPSKSVLGHLERAGLSAANFFRGEGCSKCLGNGHLGRVACFEALRFNDFLAEIVAGSRPAESVRRAAQSQNLLVSYRDYARSLIGAGLLAPQEALRAFAQMPSS